MKRPSQAWCAQIDITNACHLHCSNCTRLLDHAHRRFFMSLECVEQAVLALKDFPTTSERDPRGKVVGLIGGEPLLHPEFPAIVDIVTRHIPRVEHRGLWTSRDWKTGTHPKWGPYRPQVERLVGPHEGNGRGVGGKQGWLNWNMHLESMQVRHQPVLAASRDLVPDRRERWNYIEQCWLQAKWSPTVTPDGFFFCEVAGAINTVLGGVPPIDVGPDMWKGDLEFITDVDGVRQPVGKFAEQIKAACERCGVCIPMPGRRDKDEADDVTASIMPELERVRSPRLKQGRVFVLTEIPPVHGWNPRQYVKGERPTDQSAAAAAAGGGRR